MIASIWTIESYSLILHVLQQEPVSYVVALRQASVLLAVLVGWIGVKEPYGPLRLMSAAGMFIGFYLVITA